MTTTKNATKSEAPIQPDRWVGYVAAERKAGSSDDAIRAAIVATSTLEPSFRDRAIDRAFKLAAEMGPSVRRRITEDDASVYGSQYLGREGHYGR